MFRWLRLAAPLVCISALWGVDWKALKPEGYVSDFAHVVDPAARAQLEAYCASVERSTGVQMALVTIPSLQGEPVEDVANAIFRAWGIGQKDRNNGILMLLAIEDHRMRLEVGYGLERVIPNGLAGDILDEMRPAVRQQRYGEAMLAAAQTIGQTLAEARNVGAPAPLRRQVRRTLVNSIPWPLAIGGIFVLLWVLRAGGSRRFGGQPLFGLMPGFLMGNLIGRATWGARGSGGFGGYDSADGFGGFGGGDTGGAGASSDW